MTGTTGAPQVVIPQMADQPYWAGMVEETGILGSAAAAVARRLTHRRATAPASKIVLLGVLRRHALREVSNIGVMRVGIADHLGWAVAVTATADHRVVDRRRIKLVEPEMTPAPIHYESHRLDVAATAALVAEVRASVARAASAALDQIAATLAVPIMSISLRAWPLDFPDDVAVQRRSPYEARADAIMYRQILSELAHARGYHVHLYDAKKVEAQAVTILAERAEEVLNSPRVVLGRPWAKDHRIALAATIVAGLDLSRNG